MRLESANETILGNCSTNVLVYQQNAHILVSPDHVRMCTCAPNNFAHATAQTYPDPSTPAKLTTQWQFNKRLLIENDADNKWLWPAPGNRRRQCGEPQTLRPPKGWMRNTCVARTCWTTGRPAPKKEKLPAWARSSFSDSRPALHTGARWAASPLGNKTCRASLKDAMLNSTGPPTWRNTIPPIRQQRCCGQTGKPRMAATLAGMPQQTNHARRGPRGNRIVQARECRLPIRNQNKC